MNGGIDPKRDKGTGPINIKDAVNHWTKELEQARMIRGLKTCIIICGVIMGIELVLIVLLILMR